MKNNTPKLLGIALLAGAVLAGGCGNSTDEMLVSGKNFMAKGDYPAAIIQLKNALAKTPNSGEARLLLGRSLLDSGDAVSAEVELRKALDLKFSADEVVPALARALLAQGQVGKLEGLASSSLSSAESQADLKTSIAQGLASQGKFDVARRLLEEAIAAKKDFAPALLGLARMKIVGNDPTGAMTLVDEVLARDAANANAWIFKADLLRAQGKIAEAIPAYQKGLEVRPQSVAAHAALTMIYLRDKKQDLAEKQLAAMQKVAANNPFTYYMQGLTAYERQDMPAARAAAENLLRFQPDNPNALQLAGMVAYESRSDVLAQEYFRKALQKAPELDFARRVLVMSYLRSGQPAKAVEALQPVLHGDDTQTTWLSLAGNAHIQAGNTRLAEEFFQRAARVDPGNKRTQTALALTRLQSGHADEAFADLEHIAAMEDKDTSADMALIASSLGQKKFDKALKAIANLEKKQPDSPVAHNLRGNVLIQKGDTEGARKNFEKALALNPAYMPAVAALARMDLLAKKPDEARQRYEAVLAKDSKNTQALLAIADIQTRMGAKPDEIALSIGKAVAAAPAEPAPRLALIELYVRNKEYAKAQTAVQEALSIIPNRPELLDVAGQVFQLNGDTNQALATYGKLSSLLPTAMHPYLRMADIHVGTKNYESARVSLNKGLSLLPDSLPLQRALILLDVQEKRFDTALSKARELQRKQPRLSAGHVLEGDIHVINKAWGQAVNAYRAGLNITPVTEVAERIHAALLMDDKAAEANAFAENWLKTNPKDNAFRLFLAESANKRKNHAAAAALYRGMLAAQPNNPALMNNLAMTLGAMKDPQALALAEQANTIAPNEPALMDTLAMLLVEQGKTDRGIDLLRKALRITPRAESIRLNLAKALLKAGKKTEAKQELESLGKLGDGFPAQQEVAELLKGL